ncbi:MAG TPA: MFS transporter [Rugosimonospora sp.]|nr:MFS transporter [Rugosimonospora sp.]
MSTSIRAHGNLRATLASRGFRRLLAVRLSSQLVDGLFQAGLAGSLLFNPQKAASAQAIAAGFALLLLPYSVVGPYVGVFLDRWSRRTVIYAANLVRAALVIPAALLIWYGQQSIPYAVLALFIIGINRFFLSGLSAAQPHVVVEHRLVTANALATTLGTVVYSLGLGLAALVLNTVVAKNDHGYATIAVVAAAGYATSALTARASFGIWELGPDDTERTSGALLPAIVEVARGMVAGLRHLAVRPAPRYAMLVQSAYRVLYGVLTIATLLLYRRYFNVGDNYSKSLSGLAMIVLAGGLGSLAAAFLTPPVTRRIGGWRWIVALLGGAGALLLVLVLPFRPTLLVLATFCVSVASQGTKIVVDTSLQTDCDDDFRGRVFSVNDTTYNLAFVAGLFIGAFGLPADGHSIPAIVLVSLGYIAVAAGYGVLASRGSRRVELPRVDARVG